MDDSYCCCVKTFSREDFIHELSIEDLCKCAKTGDIILFSGLSSASKFVEMACSSKWSHIGIVYENPNKLNDPLILESVHEIDGTIGFYSKKLAKGVRLVNLRNYITKYHGKSIALRQIQTNSKQNYTRLNKIMNTKLSQIINSNLGKNYENRWLEFFLAKFWCLGTYGETNDSFFCSELVMYCYKHFGIIPEYYNKIYNNQMLPDDFSETGNKLHFTMPKGLYGQIQLSRERFIDFRDKKNNSKFVNSNSNYNNNNNNILTNKNIDPYNLMSDNNAGVIIGSTYRSIIMNDHNKYNSKNRFINQ